MQPTDYEMHEALDRTSNVTDIVERQLLDHPVFKKKKYRKHVDRVVKELTKLYQKLGVAHFGESGVGESKSADLGGDQIVTYGDVVKVPPQQL